MKTILLPFERHDLIESAVRTAALLGQAFGSYVEGCALGPPLSPFIGADAIGGTIYDPGVYVATEKTDRQTAEETRLEFEKTMTGLGWQARSAATGAGPSFGWLPSEPVADSFVGSYGRVFDLTVVARPGITATSPRMSTLEAALFDSGRPILIAPPRPPASLGTVVSVAWNRSTETARTVALAMPILRRAKKVVILSIETSTVPGPSAEQLQRYFALGGIASEIVLIEKTEARLSGPLILEEATKNGSDLVVKGAYTQSRLRQMIFGGATNHIIAETELPVLMAH